MKKLLLSSLALLLFSYTAQSQLDTCSRGVVDGNAPTGAGNVTINGNNYDCRGIDIQSFISYSSLGGQSVGGFQGNDNWGWTDDRDGHEYALLGLTNGTYFVRVTDPENPELLGRLNGNGSASSWRDIKTYKHYAFIVSEASGHGMQMYDLYGLQALSPSNQFNLATETAAGRYAVRSSYTAHNVITNEDSDLVYVLGSSSFSGGPLIYRIDDSFSVGTNNGFISFVNGYSGEGYTHDAQVVTYDGPDLDYQGKEIFIGSNGNLNGSNEIMFADLTDFIAGTGSVDVISTIGYANSRYAHQGWFTEDKKYFIFGDEHDEISGGVGNTKTIVLNVEDLDSPFIQFNYQGRTAAIDHNGYVRGERFYLGNYTAGISIKRIHNIDDAITPNTTIAESLDGTTGNMVEEAYFDTYRPNNGGSFAGGAWNMYPYFESGNLIVSNLENGVFILKQQNYDNTPPVADNSAYTATLDKATGSVTISAADLTASSTDNVAITKRTITSGQTTFTCADVGQTFNISFEIEDDFGLKASATRAVTVEAEETRYNGGDITLASSWTQGLPGPGSEAFIRSNATLTSGNGIDACSCRIRSARTLTVNAGAYLNTEGNIDVGAGTLTVKHQGIVKQLLDGAVTTKTTGAINVEITTPFMKPRDFLIMGSPMDLEQRNDAFANAFLVLDNTPANFIPASGISTANGTNFADENGNDWNEYPAGSINVGEGYLVRPQMSYTDGNATYDMTYTKGVLNSGEVKRPVTFNGFGSNPDGTPNIVANPYASPISTAAFLAENPNIGTVYFWEHLTPPNFSIPGHVGLRFDMDDISQHNGSGGLKAAKDVTTATLPDDFISTGQGFSFFANNLTGDVNGDIRFTNAMRRTTNNNTLTRPANVDRVWLDVTMERYELGSSTLIAFNPIATPGFDFGYDTERLATIVSLYTFTENEQKKLGIQTREALENNMVLKLGFSSQINENLEYTLSVSDFDGALMEGSTVYLIDQLTNITTNLSQEAYTFTAGGGDSENRFLLQFEVENILDTETNAVNKIVVYPNPTKENLTISSPLTYIDRVEVFDIRGRRMAQDVEAEQNSFTISLAGLETSVYFVKVITQEGTVTKKVIKE